MLSDLLLPHHHADGGHSEEGSADIARPRPGGAEDMHGDLVEDQDLQNFVQDSQRPVGVFLGAERKMERDQVVHRAGEQFLNKQRGEQRKRSCAASHQQHQQNQDVAGDAGRHDGAIESGKLHLLRSARRPPRPGNICCVA